MKPNVSSSALPKHVLESLLKSGQESQDENKGIDKNGVALALVRPLQSAFANWLSNVRVELAQESVRTQPDWWKQVGHDRLIVGFAAASGAVPESFLILPSNLVATSLAAQLGGVYEASDNAQLSRLGKISIRFAERMSTNVWAAAGPVLGLEPGMAALLQASDIDESDNIEKSAFSVFSYFVKSDGQKFTLDLVLPGLSNAFVRQNNIEFDSLSHLPKLKDIYDLKNISIRIDAIIKIEKQTLDKINKLKIGDTVSLSGGLFSDVILSVRGKNIFKGEFGKFGQKYSIKLSSRLDDLEANSGKSPHFVNRLERDLPNRLSAAGIAAPSASDLAESEKELNRAIADLRGVAAIDKGLNGNSTAAYEVGASIAMQIPVEVNIVLGSVEMLVGDLAQLKSGSIISLDRKAGEQVDVVVNGVAIAKGQIILVGEDQDRFGLRITETLRRNCL